jgi:polyhydroxyalkanoate synthesis regulator phasin
MPTARSSGRGSSSSGQKRPERSPGTTGKVAAARDRVVRSVLTPLNVVLISRKNVEELFDDAVKRGRMTRSDAQEMVQSIVTRGARVTDDLLADIERLIGRGESLEPAADDGAGTSASANLPIAGYDDLSAAQVQERLEGLTPAQLRKLRDYEQRHANRKTVLDRIERRLR